MSYSNQNRLLMQKNLAPIGFPKEPAEWVNAPAHFSDVKLEILGHPVMEAWEEPYMKELARIATLNGGVVLEVGFGLGISVSFVQQYQIKEHIIIEANLKVFQRLKAFAAQASHKVTPLLGLWQDVVPTLTDESIDGILFDPYPLNELEINGYQFPFFRHAYRLLKPGGILTYYSDEVDSFSSLHIEQLRLAGFSIIEHTLCLVSPPLDCLYWQSNKILAPIVRKK